MQDKALKNLILTIDPSSFLDFKEYLETVYVRLKQAKGRYSYIKFATDLGFSPTNIIHQYIQGRRPLTLKVGRKIADGLGLVGFQRKFFLLLVQLKTAKSSEAREKVYEKILNLKQQEVPRSIDSDMMSYYEQWYHGAIRELTRLDEFKSDPTWISKKLSPRVRPEKIKESLALLERLEMIQFDESSGRHVPIESSVSTGHEVFGMAIMKYHGSVLDIAQQQLSAIDPVMRDYSSLMLALDQDGITRLKTLIHQFQMQLMREDARPQDREQVVQVNIQLYPITED